eukprot:m.144312 g.144312  ORF g.144312 m.144312 type:complete len:94 (-) comp14916_c0_seq1:1391-1672(-)
MPKVASKKTSRKVKPEQSKDGGGNESMEEFFASEGYRPGKKDLLTPFRERVYKLVTAIPEGYVTTYGDIAKALESSPRAVGGAMRHNPFVLVP